MAMGAIPVTQPGAAIKALHVNGSRTPLFWCFNAPAPSMGALASQMSPDQPFYGLFSGGRLFEKSDAVFSKIAEFYAEEIVSLYPDGPYRLGGTCQGAKVALKIARILQASGRVVDRLCLLELASPDFYDYDGQLLLMYGKRSKHRVYRSIGWGKPGWRKRFLREPVVEWVPGQHGGLLRPHNVIGLARVVERFLQNPPQPANPLLKLESRVLSAIHRRRILFYVFFRLAVGWERLVYGRKLRINAFTGEPVK
jgi:hypothetical protein